MANILEGKPNAQGLKIGIVVSRFNNFVTERLLEGALDGFASHGGADGDLTVVRVPGAFEIPIVADKMAASGKYDALVCLGAVIRGDTPHFEYVAGQAASGIMRASIDTGIPVLFGVITADTIEQVEDRCGEKEDNKGYEAARSAIEMAHLMRVFDDKIEANLGDEPTDW